MDLTSSETSSDESQAEECLHILEGKINSTEIFIVPAKLFEENRNKLVHEIKKTFPNSIVVLQGERQSYLFKSNIKAPFRQEPFFLWLFGVDQPGYYGALDVETCTSYLFYPPMEYECSNCLKFYNDEEIRKEYGVDTAVPLKNMDVKLATLNREYLLILEKTKDKLDFPSLDCFNVSENVLWQAMTRCRITKTAKEVQLIKYITNITCEGHRFVMKFIKPPLYGYEVESMFKFYMMYTTGCGETAGPLRCTTVQSLAEGDRVSVFRSGNDELISENDTCFLGMGASYGGYRVHIASTYPATGQFTTTQKNIHLIVTEMRRNVLECLVPYESVERLEMIASQVLIKKLVLLNVLKGRTQDIVSDGVADIFRPNSFFNLVGIDVEDIKDDLAAMEFVEGSSANTETILVPDMVISLTYTCYFMPHKLENVALTKYVTKEINKYINCGATIQDVILITNEGFEIISRHPISVEDIEDQKNKCDFRDRKGKGIDILEGEKLFPPAKQMIEKKLKKIYQQHMNEK